MFASIVVALDLEREGDRALHIVGSLSALTAMTVELLTVASPGIPEEADAFELRRRATANGWPVDCYTILHDNDPARAIADHVNSRPGALLIMSTTAKSPLRRRFLGSVSENVLSRVHGPALLVGPHVPADADRLEEFIGGVEDPVLVATSTNWTDDRNHWHSTTRRLVQRATRPVLVIPASRSSTTKALADARQ